MNSSSCSFKKCYRLNLRRFLEAFRCSLCDQIFCLEHRNPEEHDCHILLNKEKNRLELVRTHERVINKLSNYSDSDQCGSKKNNIDLSEGSLYGLERHRSEATITNKNKNEEVQNLNAIDSVPVAVNHRYGVTRANPAIERIKIRMRCVGDESVPSYDRYHVRIQLKDDIIREDTTAKSSPVLPSQKRPTKPGFSKTMGPTSDLYVWLDKTKSIGWIVDFLIRYFKLSSISNLRPQLCLARMDGNTNSIERLPYIRLVSDTISDGEPNLCLIKK